jgi:hypothetical protein
LAGSSFRKTWQSTVAAGSGRRPRAGEFTVAGCRNGAAMGAVCGSHSRSGTYRRCTLRGQRPHHAAARRLCGRGRRFPGIGDPGGWPHLQNTQKVMGQANGSVAAWESRCWLQ